MSASILWGVHPIIYLANLCILLLNNHLSILSIVIFAWEMNASRILFFM